MDLTERIILLVTGAAIAGVGYLMHDAPGAALIFFGGLVAVGALYQECDER